MTATTAALRLDRLSVEYGSADGPVRALHETSLKLRPGRVLGLVGESGSGKSTLGLAALGLLGPAARVAGRIEVAGQDVTGLSERRWRTLRGRRVGMVFQEPMTALNPVMSVGEQIAETLRPHLGLSRRQARDRTVELLDRVGIREPAATARRYPHQLSGGMRQRVGIAMAIGCGPDLLVADEPTTALDTSVQAQILSLLRDLVDRLGLAVLLITHDLGVVSRTADEVVVLYRGCVVESGRTPEVVGTPAHPYTHGLLDCAVTVDRPRDRPLRPIRGTVERLTGAPDRCPFRARCDRPVPECSNAMPALRGTDRLSACFNPVGA